MNSGYLMLDTTEFPIVRMDVERRTQGGNGSWIAEMDGLLEGGRPFVLIAAGRESAEPAEQSRIRARWYRVRRDALGAICKGMIYIEPDPAIRAALESETDGLSKAVRFPFAIVENEPAARMVALRFLAG